MICRLPAKKPPTEEEMQGDPKKKLWKSTHAQYQLLEDITTMLRTQGVSEAQNGAEFVKQCLTLPLLRYMYLTQQVLDALLWYKRFAQSVLNVEASDAGDNAGNEMIGG